MLIQKRKVTKLKEISSSKLLKEGLELPVGSSRREYSYRSRNMFTDIIICNYLLRT